MTAILTPSVINLSDKIGVGGLVMPIRVSSRSPHLRLMPGSKVISKECSVARACRPASLSSKAPLTVTWYLQVGH